MTLQAADKQTNQKGSRSQAGDVLHEAFVEGQGQHANGEYRDVAANISAENSRVLKRFVRELKPQLVVEIRMAYGGSTLSILSATRETGVGRLISIDPYIGWPTGRQVALNQVPRAGVSPYS